MKNKRQEAINELISRYEIETQEELIEKLLAEGFAATQATISRDIRELKISKVLGKNGKYHYTAATAVSGAHIRNPYAESVISVVRANNLVVIKTKPGLAQGVAAGVDAMESGDILGSVAGDDTILTVAATDESAERFIGALKKALGID